MKKHHSPLYFDGRIGRKEKGEHRIEAAPARRFGVSTAFVDRHYPNSAKEMSPSHVQRTGKEVLEFGLGRAYDGHRPKDRP